MIEIRDGEVQHRDDGWYFWAESFRIAGHHIAGNWCGPFEDQDECEGAAGSYLCDQAQEKYERGADAKPELQS